jgi:hypothetical protein
MFIHYAALAAAAATAALAWRNLLLDHPRFLGAVKNMPAVGDALTCGFCSTLWLTFPFALFDQSHSVSFSIFWIAHVWFVWFALGALVLFVRNILSLVMDAAAVLNHAHSHMHEHEE